MNTTKLKNKTNQRRIRGKKNPNNLKRRNLIK